ncbi:MAG: hypothetical protein HYX51_04190 [Chloroflexi bacterium]|nr:hypothetical protein [Chloroflexota bacterium]
MASDKPRVSIDANVIIAGIGWPRWSFEVLNAIRGDAVDLVLLEQTVAEARRHLPNPTALAALDRFLSTARHEFVTRPASELIEEHRDLVRDEQDVPIALALLMSSVEIFVTSDRDFTDPGATADRFRTRVRVMLPAVFLRDVMGWTSDELEAVRNRTWDDMA